MFQTVSASKTPRLFQRHVELHLGRAIARASGLRDLRADLRAHV